MPGMVAGVFIASVVDVTAKPFEQISPGRSALGASVVRVAVKQVLKGVDRGDPGEDQYDPFEQFAVGSVHVSRLIKRLEPARPQELHRHRGNLAEFERALAVGGQWLAA